ncbi:MAG: methyl-accepting chemotaxis protein [Cyanobacteria bacterium P01_D01_bin.1]
MTAQRFSPDDSSQLLTPPPAPQLPKAPAAQSSAQQGRTLSRQLLQTLLPVALLPLVVASGLSIVITRRAEREDALFLLKEESFLASEAASVFVEDNFKIMDAVRLNPTLLQALRQADERIESEDLDDQSIEQLEQAFAQNKLVSPDATLNQYLSDVALVEGMSGLSVTERRGLNVAYSSLTDDFVQRDEDWWIQAQESKQYIGSVTADESNGAVGLLLSEAVTPADSDEFLGVMRATIPTRIMDERIATYVSTVISDTQRVQVIDTRSGTAFSTVSPEGIAGEIADVVGGEPIAAIAQTLTNTLQTATGESGEGVIQGPVIGDLDALEQSLAPQVAGKIVELEELDTISGQAFLTMLVETDDREYSLTTVPNTAWVAISSADISTINSAGRNLLILYAITAVTLGIATALFLRQLALQMSQPLQRLTETAQRATSGDLNARANLQGTQETRLLGRGFNTLLDQLQSLLSAQMKQTEEQRQQRELLEEEITRLMEDVGDAADGDLSVRAQLSEGDVGIVADLINAIVENLRDIAVNVKQSTGNVSDALGTNERQILDLAEQAAEEARTMQSTMVAVTDMNQSIQAVADNANQASMLTNDTYTTVQAGSNSMDQTAKSISELRSTVGETAKKIKRLGESAQKIAQAVSLIDSIALKTNLLAVNASVEAARAGELGQGFTAVAEQVSALAEQSAGATQTIAQIVTEIQTETQEVVSAIETGTAQVVDSTQLVKTTQQQLEEVLAKSNRINQLMQEISNATVDQTNVSKAVGELIQKATQNSEERSQTSAQLAQAIQDTAQVTKTLQASVEQFKVPEE